MRIGSRDPPTAEKRGHVPPPDYDGVDFARRYVSDSYVPDDVAVAESVRFIRETVGDCMIYGLGMTALGRLEDERKVNFVVVIPSGDTCSIRRRLALGLANMHLDARVEVIAESQMKAYRDDPNSISHEAFYQGVLLRCGNQQNDAPKGRGPGKESPISHPGPQFGSVINRTTEVRHRLRLMTNQTP